MSLSGDKPNFSKTPGRNGSRKTSALERMVRRTAFEEGDFRSMMMEDLRRVRLSGGPKKAFGRSMRTTSAPKSERRRLLFRSWNVNRRPDKGNWSQAA